jgi:hypothetical protein
MQADAPEIEITRNKVLSEILLEMKMVASKAEFKRLVSEKAVKDLKNGQPVDSFDYAVSQDMDLRIGKHRFLKIRIKQ